VAAMKNVSASELAQMLTEIDEVVETPVTKLYRFVPMLWKEKKLGFLALNVPSNTKSNDTIDHRFFSAFIKQASVALENSLLIFELQQMSRTLASHNLGLKKEIDELAAEKAKAIETVRVIASKEEKRYDFSQIVTQSPQMENVFQLIYKLKDSHLPILITGESGTGKELIARAIHFQGSRKDKPFFAENCGAVTETLLESELFGYVKGAFTGATQNKRGLLELADGGTLFLDEVGEMSPEMQKKLLRVLEDGMIRPVGGEKNIKVDVRFICATLQHLDQLVKTGTFRQDLLFRINVAEIKVPPLRARKEDIPLLVDHFLQKYSHGQKRQLSDRHTGRPAPDAHHPG
jgi:transcriptional regulator with PAS, ATPase and Fis domain